MRTDEKGTVIGRTMKLTAIEVGVCTSCAAATCWTEPGIGVIGQWECNDPVIQAGADDLENIGASAEFQCPRWRLRQPQWCEKHRSWHENECPGCVDDLYHVLTDQP